MERECFEQPAIAAILNEHFVSIKVDREERPDVDQLYMTAVQVMTRRGGWPMSVWLTPALKPFYAGTYFPKTARGGLPGFSDLCRAIAAAYRDRRDDVEAQVGGFMENEEPQSPLRMTLLMSLPVDPTQMGKLVAKAQTGTDSCYHRVIDTATKMMKRGENNRR